MPENRQEDTTGTATRRTGYEKHGRPETTHGFMRSAWSLVMILVLLALVGAAVWSYWPKAKTDPAPAGSAGNVVPTAPGPTQGAN